jgi:tetratricopeptide (TPR) repeat protein
MTARLARKAEEAEQYADAIKIYEDYLKANAQAPDHATLSERVTQLKALNGHLRIAETWLSQGDYAEARKDFDAALKIRPESKLAKAGLERADAGIKRK